MKQIGFKNFRRFANFPPMDLAPITIFVGENNAGKSTVVKGILALSDFLTGWMDSYDFSIEEILDSKKAKKAIVEKLKNQKFYFNKSYLAHIGTFKRALYNKADNNTISFFMKLGSQELTIDVLGNRNDEEAVSGIISKIIMDYPIYGIHIEYNLQEDTAEIKFSPVSLDEEQTRAFPKNQRKAIRNFLESIQKEYVLTYNLSDYYRRFVPDLLYSLSSSVEIAISATIGNQNTNKYMGAELVNKLKPIEGLSDDCLDFLKKYTNTVCNNTRSERWIFSLPDPRIFRSMSRIEYLYAHAVTQTIIYSAKDTNDYISKTIHEFASIPKTKNDYRRVFIKEWMEEFNIGKDYAISSVGGEAHIVKIENNDGEFVNLADKGMGSIQLMVLLFRLAITLPKQKIESNETRKHSIFRSRIIIMEEPEQNLHPMLQSKLADLLYHLNIDYGYRFIIETHSEYLIRKTQVIVKNIFSNSDLAIKENPFKVYYFNSESSEKTYYEIIYQKDGCFSNDFGKGFFDEASNLAYKII